ncbi:MAG: DUF4981 domain-containing protein, partial [Lachnospiraceae bacterium]|nr:DUF4981 domain-containing protein [Lachnospiraceae bacterium]
NGKRLLLKGVNRHDTDPEYGKYIRKEVYETDVKTMKRNNINALRTSHYPNDDYMYYLCDKYGIYVMCEANNESHALQNSEAEILKMETAMTSRQSASYERFKNTTCNLIWSIGNETSRALTDSRFAEGIFAKMISYYKDRDSSRMVHYEGICENLSCHSGVDMISHMYYSPDSIVSAAKSSKKMPYILCEYCHAMGNAVGSISDYWDVIRSSNVYLGGYIWDYVDQSRKVQISEGDYDYYSQSYAKKSDLNDLAGYFLGYAGDWGDSLTFDNNFCMNGLLSADRTPQPELKEVKFQYQNFWFNAEATDGKISTNTFSVTNESASKNLSDYDVTYEVLENDKVVDSGVISDEVAPWETKDITIDYKLPASLKAGADYYLNIYVKTKTETEVLPAGYEVSYRQFEIAADTATAYRKLDTAGLSMEDTDAAYIIKGNSFSFDIDKTTGVLKNYTYNGKVLITEGPRANVLRGKLDNDYITSANLYDNTSLKEAPTVTTDSYGRIVCAVTQVFDIEGYGSGEVTFNYTVEGNGAVIVDATYNFSGVKDKNYRKVGTLLTLASGYEDIKWYGNGDSESYPDRATYTRKGVYTSTANDMFYPFAKPQDCGNLTGVKWMQVYNAADSTGLTIVGKNEINTSALHFSPDALDSANHVNELVPSKNTYVTVDGFVSGTGNASCGFITLPQYRVNGEEFEFEYTIIPMESNDTDSVMKTAKTYGEKQEYGTEERIDPDASASPEASVAPSESAAPGESSAPGESASPSASPSASADTVKKPTRVTGLKLVAKKKSMKVSFKKQSNVTYVVAYSLKKAKLNKLKNGKIKAVSGVKIRKISKNSVIIKKLKAKKKYFFKVCAVSKKNKKLIGNYSAVKAKKTK